MHKLDTFQKTKTHGFLFGLYSFPLCKWRRRSFWVPYLWGVRHCRVVPPSLRSMAMDFSHCTLLLFWGLLHYLSNCSFWMLCFWFLAGLCLASCLVPFDAVWSPCRRRHFHSNGRPTWPVGLLCVSVYIQRSRSLFELANIQVVSIWSLLLTLKIASVNLFALRHVEHKNKPTKWGEKNINYIWIHIRTGRRYVQHDRSVGNAAWAIFIAPFIFYFCSTTTIHK